MIYINGKKPSGGFTLVKDNRKCNLNWKAIKAIDKMFSRVNGKSLLSIEAVGKYLVFFFEHEKYPIKILNMENPK